VADSVLRELVNLVERTGMLWDGPALLAGLEDRRSAQFNRAAGGLALPHSIADALRDLQPLSASTRARRNPFGAPMVA